MIPTTLDIDDNNNSKESEIEIESGQTNYQLETSNFEFADPVCLFDLQVSPQFISEEDNDPFGSCTMSSTLTTILA
jgi:hypothetical protein